MALAHDPALNPPKPLKYRMRGYGGGPNHTSLHPRHWDTVKTITYVPGIGYCRTSEAIPYLRRLIDAKIAECKAQLREHQETEKLIDAYEGQARDEFMSQAAELRRSLEELLLALQEAKGSLGTARGVRSSRREGRAR